MSLALSHGASVAVSAAPGASPAPLVAGSAAQPLPDGVPTDLELDAVARVNADRQANGLPPLTTDLTLLDIARQRAAQQVPLPQLSHYDAAGQPAVAPLLAAAQVGYQLAGENLVRLPGPDGTTTERAEAALMNSPSHRANILQPRFDRIGVGQAIDGSGRVVFVQLFTASV